MKNITITKRNKNGFLISAIVTGLGFLSSFPNIMLIGIGCLIFVLSDNSMVKS